MPSRATTRITAGVDWDAAKADPVAFARQLLRTPAGDPIVPHPAQEAILRGIHRWTAIVTGRQFGKTAAMGWDATWYATTHANRTVMVIAPSLEQAKLIFNEIAHYFRSGPLKSLVEGKVREYPFPEIRLKNGTVLMARGANSPQYIRGNRVHRAYVDEAAFVKDTVITDVIEPMFTVTGKEEDSALILISTPFGRGAFYDYYQAGDGTDPAYASFHFTSYDNPHADRAMLERVKARWGEASLLWRTEYLGIFDTDDRAVFPWADIKYATENWPFGDEWPIGVAADHRYVQGVDLANLRDYFVASVVDETDPARCYLARLDRYQKRGYPFYKGIVRRNHHDYRVPHGKTLVDATSLGESVVQDLADIGAEGYKFGGEQAKFEVVQDLARMLAEHRLLLPPQRDIIDELRYFEYEVTAAKRLKMEAKQGHDDIVMSLALAAHLAAIPRRLGLMRPVTLPLGPRARPQKRVRREDRIYTPGGPDDPFAALFRDPADHDAEEMPA